MSPAILLDPEPFDPEDPDTLAAIEQAGQEFLQQLERRPGIKVPLLPQIAMKILSLASRPDTSIRQIEATLQVDPMLAAKVLAIASSPAFTARPASSLRHALMCLGTTRLYDVLHQVVAEAHIFKGSKGELLVNDRLHGIAVGHIARNISVALHIDGEQAFLCGLLHDIGRIIMRKILDETPLEGLPDEAIPVIVARFHDRVGEYVARTWRLPDVVPEAARRHHEYTGDGTYSRIGNLVAAAELIADHHGIGHTAVPLAGEHHPVFADLGLTPQQVVDLVERSADLEARMATG